MSVQQSWHTSANPWNSSGLPMLFRSFQLVGKTHVHLAWPAWHNNKSETLFKVIKHLIHGTIYYINIFTNLSWLSFEICQMSKLSCESRHLASAYCLCQSFVSCTSLYKIPQENCRFTDDENKHSSSDWKEVASHNQWIPEHHTHLHFIVQM